MIMDLARHFAQKGNEPSYSIVFIAFSGEEAGLEGSRYFANNPLFPLENIKMLVNLDMVGTGDEGITVVNGAVLKQQFSLLEEINQRNNYLKEVKARGESCNSDHCPFYMKGVPAFFIYTRSSIFNEYHSLEDVPERLPLNGYEGLFRLLADFTREL
jgi:Zn-dependent M28 family amino/carboxypeptidase